MRMECAWVVHEMCPPVSGLPPALRAFEARKVPRTFRPLRGAASHPSTEKLDSSLIGRLRE